MVRQVLAPASIDDSEPLIGDMVRKSIRWVKRAEDDSLEIVLWVRRIMLDTAGKPAVLGAYDGKRIV